MLDFEKNDYEVREKGTNFWGEKRYELIEKPKGPGCFAVVIFLIIFLVSLFSNDDTETNDQKQPAPEPIRRIPSTKRKVNKVSDNENQGISNPFGSEDNNTGGSQGNASYDNSTFESYNPEDDYTQNFNSENEIKNEPIKNDVSNLKSIDDSIREMMDSLKRYTTYNKHKRIKIIQQQLNVSKHHVKKVLRH